MKHISHTMHLKLICILFLVGFSQSLTRKEYRFKASLKHRSGVQRPISKHENGLPLECQVSCRIGEAFTFMVPLDTECPKNMEDIDEVKISAKDYCSKIPESGKATVCSYCRISKDPIKHTLQATYEGKKTFIYPDQECSIENIAFYGKCVR